MKVLALVVRNENFYFLKHGPRGPIESLCGKLYCSIAVKKSNSFF